MGDSASASSFASLLEPLCATLGERLTLRRSAGGVEWVFDGQSAIVHLESTGTACATFVARTAVDAVSRRDVAPVYRARTRYRLDAEGCRRMADDLAAFFSGVREPRFTFVDAR
jgi:hypothetical protein